MVPHEVDSITVLINKHHVLGAVVGGILTHGANTILSDTTSDAYHHLVDNIKQEEGYKAKPYTDTTGNITVGFGTNISIGVSKEEAEQLLQHRLQVNGKEFAERWKPFSTMPTGVQSALVDLSYNLGVSGVLKFSKMLSDLEAGDYDKAADEILNSKYATEVPSRAKRIADEIRAG